MENNFLSNKKILIVIPILFLLVAIFFLWKIIIFNKNINNTKKMGKTDYLIQGVPYFGWHNRVGDKKFVVMDYASALSAVLEYWNPGRSDYVNIYNNLQDRDSLFKVVSEQKIVDFLNDPNNKKDEYTAEMISLENDELRKYINDDTRIPLIVFLPFSKEQTQENERMRIRKTASVIIGLKESENKIITHDYRYGNNYEITFDQLNEYWDGVVFGEKRQYLVVRPKNYETKIQEIKNRENEPYPTRTEVMVKTEKMLEDYSLGLIAAGIMAEPNKVIEYFSKVEAHADYNEWLPPFFKVHTYYHLANAYLRAGDLLKSKEYAQKCSADNHDLDKPFKDFPGIGNAFIDDPEKNGETYAAWLIWGDIYYKENNYEKAKEYYEKAKEYYPDWVGLKERLFLVQEAMNKINKEE